MIKKLKLSSYSILILISIVSILILLFVTMHYRSARLTYVGHLIPLSNTPKFIDPNLFPTEGGKSYLFIVFSLNDCPICLFEAEYWSLASIRLSDRLQVIGVTDSISSKRLTQFQVDYGIDFPIIKNPMIFKRIKERLLDLNIAFVTPIKILVNEHNNIIAIEGGTKELERQTQFPKRIADILTH